jgi:hypothetical protein
MILRYHYYFKANHSTTPVCVPADALAAAEQAVATCDYFMSIGTSG